MLEYIKVFEVNQRSILSNFWNLTHTFFSIALHLITLLNILMSR